MNSIDKLLMIFRNPFFYVWRALRKLDNTFTILLLGKISRRKCAKGSTDAGVGQLLLFILENLGDTIAASPVFNMISKENWVVCSRYNAPVIDMFGFKNMIVINRDPGLFDFLKVWYRLRETSFSSSIILDHTRSGDFGILVSRFLQTGTIVSGFDKSVTGDVHITELIAENENMDILSLSKVSIAGAVISIDEKNLRKEIQPDCGAHFFGDYRDFVGIHAGGLGSVGYPVSRRYPADHMIELIKLVVQKGYKVVLTGDKNDMKSFGKHSVMGMEKCFVDLSGKLSIKQLACLLKELKCYITPDNGTLHLAQAVGCKRIYALLGPTAPAIVKGKNTEIISLGLPCSPCLTFLKFPKECINPERNACLQQLLPMSVMERVMMTLDEGLHK